MVRFSYSTSWPKGVRASPASLKCCMPKGMPMMVMQKITPKSMCDRNIHIPPIKNQMTFIKKDRQPLLCGISTTLLPNGHSANTPSFKVCNPKGIPIIVMNSPTLEMKYSMAMNSPPKTTQIIFPKIFMFIVLIFK